MSGMEEGRPPKGNWDLRAQDQGGKGHTGSRGMQRTKKEIVGYYCEGGGEESPPPPFPLPPHKPASSSDGEGHGRIPTSASHVYSEAEREKDGN